VKPTKDNTSDPSGVVTAIGHFSWVKVGMDGSRVLSRRISVLKPLGDSATAQVLKQASPLQVYAFFSQDPALNWACGECNPACAWPGGVSYDLGTGRLSAR